MSKYRPEQIALSCPASIADGLEKWLREKLHERARISRHNGETVVFSFWPTKSEYFYISLLLKYELEKLLKEEVTIASE